MNEFLLTIFSGLVQFERSMIKQRQREGIDIAKKDGKFKGHKTELVNGGKEGTSLTGCHDQTNLRPFSPVSTAFLTPLTFSERDAH